MPSLSWTLFASTVLPGLIETNMTKSLFEIAKASGNAHKIGQLNPMGRPGSTNEVANVVLFLASDNSSYINGQSIAIDGGLSTSHPVKTSGRVKF